MRFWTLIATRWCTSYRGLSSWAFIFMLLTSKAITAPNYLGRKPTNFKIKHVAMVPKACQKSVAWENIRVKQKESAEREMSPHCSKGLSGGRYATGVKASMEIFWY